MSHSESESEATSEALDPWQVKNEASALAQHLHQAGVQWLPQPDPHSITKWSHRFGAAQGSVESKAVVESNRTTEQDLAQRGDLPNDQRKQAEATQSMGANPQPTTFARTPFVPHISTKVSHKILKLKIGLLFKANRSS